MYEEAVLYTESPVGIIKLLGEFISCDAEKLSHLIKVTCIQYSFGGKFMAVLQQIQYEKMKYDIIISKAFRLPYPKQRISIKQITVYCKRNVGAVRGIVLPHIRSEPALQTSSLVIVGPGTFLFEFISALEAVDEKVTDIFPGFG